jgi:hypothetical protein
MTLFIMCTLKHCRCAEVQGHILHDTQRAEEYRKRKAGQAEIQQGHPASDLPSHQQSRVPRTGLPGGVFWWPGERVIGGGPWSQLPRWRNDDDISRTSAPPSKALSMPHLEPKQIPFRTPLHHRARMQAAGRQTELTALSPQSMRQVGATERPQTAPDVMVAHSGRSWHLEKQHQPSSNTNKVSRTTAEAQAHAGKHMQKLASGQQPSHAERQHVGKQHDQMHSTELENISERVVPVPRPAAQKLTRRAGSVPNFKELHSAWSECLAAAKASMHKRLTKPQVST